VLSVDNKHLIKVLREGKHTVREFLTEFPIWYRGGLNHLLEKKIDKFGCVEHIAGSGRLLFYQTDSM